MEKEDFFAFVGKKVKIIKITDGIRSFYTGNIKKINEDSILFVGKYGELILLANSDIHQMETVRVVSDE